MTILVNHQAIETFNFPGGECHIKLPSSNITEKTDILADLKNSDDIMRLLLSVDAVRRINPQTNIDLTIPHFPYARQDRVCNQCEALSVKVMTNAINNLHCTSVTIFDPHSDVTPALLNNCKVVTQADIITNCFLANEILDKSLTLVSPDAGAEKKIQAVIKKIASDKKSVDVIFASKKRDTLTGKIISTNIYDDVKNKNLMIIDDICDGGKTFIELAKLLKTLGANNIYLYVTHGIFSKGLDVLRENFNHVYCCHTMLELSEIDNEFLTIIRVSQ